MFKVLILRAQHNLWDALMEFMLQDRLSWMRFAGFDLGQKTQDENTIRLFRNKLTESGALKQVMKAFDWQLKKKGYLPMSGQIGESPTGGPCKLLVYHRSLVLWDDAFWSWGVYPRAL